MAGRRKILSRAVGVVVFFMNDIDMAYNLWISSICISSKHIFCGYTFMYFSCLGQDKLFAAYKIVSDVEEDDECAWSNILSLVGEQRQQLVDRIIQFVVADSFYVYAN